MFLEPSSFLDVEVTDDQRYLLQPTASNVLVGNILEDLIGQNAKKKIPKRCVYMMSGNIASYSHVMNNKKTLITLPSQTCFPVVYLRSQKQRMLQRRRRNRNKS
jgi:hypothetical protein